ncbi:hypothetical protein TSUD_303440 [Trifolium subterraneum]|uniref:Peptidase A1 domain-containing protein n=1 Tax=Trifolium subterraneum TaxID=3900 RepID=A0A2Z6LSU8_TRISU|nr:hypothetical protein TSUD_303440 [Trifolium subterraneum]
MLVTLLVTILFIHPTSSTSRGSLKHHKISQGGFRVTLRHVDSGKNLTKLERVQHGINRGHSRLQRLNAMVLAASTTQDSSQLEAPIHAGNGEYLMELSIGTPPISYPAVLDTGSDLIWTQCSETFTFGDDKKNQVSVKNIGFGCGEDNEGQGFEQASGITVGDTRLSIEKSTFDVSDDGSGGVIIDSGTTITYIEENAFDTLKKEFISQTKLPVDKSGGDLELPGENYMIADSSLGVGCLAMGASNGMSIFGNVQQQNILVNHDLQKETISFVPTQCNKL